MTSGGPATNSVSPALTIARAMTDGCSCIHRNLTAESCSRGKALRSLQSLDVPLRRRDRAFIRPTDRRTSWILAGSILRSAA